MKLWDWVKSKFIKRPLKVEEKQKFNVQLALVEIVTENGLMYYKVLNGEVKWLWGCDHKQKPYVNSAKRCLDSICGNSKFIRVMNQRSRPQNDEFEHLKFYSNDLSYHPIHLATSTIQEYRILKAYDYWVYENGEEVR